MLGDGAVDWRRQVSLLRKRGYDGFLTLEPHLQYETEKNLVAMMETYLARVRALIS